MSDKIDPYAAGGMTEAEREQARQQARKELMRAYRFSEADRRHNLEALKPTEVLDPEAEFEDAMARRESLHGRTCQKPSKPKKRKKGRK